MFVSSIVLTALAISLVGQGIRALQEGGLVGLSTLPLPSLPTLGLYPTAQGLLAQVPRHRPHARPQGDSAV